MNPTRRALIENENNFRREDPREYYLGKKSLHYDERDMFEPQVPLIPPNDHQDQKNEKETIEKDASLGKSETLLKDDSEKNQSQVSTTNLKTTKELLNKDSTQVLNQDSTITLDSLRDSIIQGVVNTVMNREDETVKSVISDELIKKVRDFVRISGNKEKENNDPTKIKEKNDPEIANKEVAEDQINKNQQNLQEIKDSAVNNTEKLDSKGSSDKFENLFYESKRDLNPEVKLMYQKDANAIKKENKVSASNQPFNYKDEIESDNNDNLKERRVILNDLKIRDHRKPVFIRERDDLPSFMPGSRQQRRKDFERRRFQQNEVNNEDEDEEYQDFESTGRI